MSLPPWIVIGITYTGEGRQRERETFEQLRNYVREHYEGMGKLVDGAYWGYTLGKVLPLQPHYGDAYIDVHDEELARRMQDDLRQNVAGLANIVLLDLCAQPLSGEIVETHAIRESPSREENTPPKKKKWWQYLFFPGKRGTFSGKVNDSLKRYKNKEKKTK